MANGNSDRMIGGPEDGQTPWRTLDSEPPGQVFLAHRAWIAPINPQNPTPTNFQNDTQQA